MQNTGQVACGFHRGTGAAVNVELGWVPDFVMVINLTDGDKIHMNALSKVIAFTSGGTDEIAAGDVLHGNTSDATATIKQVILDSGSWVGGDAAGWFVLDPVTLGTSFSGETAYRDGVDADGTDGVTLSAAEDQDGVDIDTEVAGTTTDATNVIEYLGSSGSASKGFTIGATIAEDAKLLYYVALRGGVTDAIAAP
jgi:hypothetical protein